MAWVPDDASHDNGPTVLFTLRLLSRTEEVLHSKDAGVHRFTLEQLDWGFTSYAAASEISTWTLHHGPLRIEVVITYLAPSMRQPISLPGASGFSKHFNSPALSDCKIILLDGNKIHAHRSTLAQSSAMFDAIWAASNFSTLQLDVQQQQQQQQEQKQELVLEADPTVAALMLRYMYGFEIVPEPAQLSALLTLTDTYQVHTLLDGLVNWLEPRVDFLQAEVVAELTPVVASMVEQHSGLPELLLQLVARAAAAAARLDTCDTFLDRWPQAAVQRMLTQPLSPGRTRACIFAAQAWVQHKPDQRQQHWEAMLGSLRCSHMPFKDLHQLCRSLPHNDIVLNNHMYKLLVAGK